MSLKIVFSVIIFLLSYAVNTVAEENTTAQCEAYANQGDCKFFLCLEEVMQCGKYGYPMWFGYYFCKDTYKVHRLYTTLGIKESRCIYDCLTKRLLPWYQKKFNGSCDDIMNAGRHDYGICEHTRSHCS